LGWLNLGHAFLTAGGASLRKTDRLKGQESRFFCKNFAPLVRC
jgi:hypothetical protein